MYEWQAPLAVHGAGLGPLYERCTNGPGALQSECFIHSPAVVGEQKRPSLRPGKEKGHGTCDPISVRFKQVGRASRRLAHRLIASPQVIEHW